MPYFAFPTRRRQAPGFFPKIFLLLTKITQLFFIDTRTLTTIQPIDFVNVVNNTPITFIGAAE